MIHGIWPWTRVNPYPCGSFHSSLLFIYLFIYLCIYFTDPCTCLQVGTPRRHVKNVILTLVLKCLYNESGVYSILQRIRGISGIALPIADIITCTVWSRYWCHWAWHFVSHMKRRRQTVSGTILAPKKEVTTGRWTILQVKRFQHLYSSSYVTGWQNQSGLDGWVM
jgi:hypothetical protein